MQVDVPWKTALHEKGERPPDWFRKELKLSEGKVASLTSRPPKERKVKKRMTYTLPFEFI
jgi:hypothetical protein